MNARKLGEIVLGLVLGVALSALLLGLRGVDAPAGASPFPLAVPDNAGALHRVVLHYSPSAAHLVEGTYIELLAALPDDVAVYVAVEAAEHVDDLTARLRAARVDRRLHAVEVGAPITTWSRDRYTLTTVGGEDWYLVVPQASDGAVRQRINDWLVPFRLAEALDDVEVVTLPIRFDGGDLLVTETHVLASHRLIEKNLGQRVDSRRDLIRLLRETFGREVLLFGDRADEVPWHHLGMYLTPLPDGRIVVGDPDLAVELLGTERALELGADLSEANLDRFRNVARYLDKAGFELERIPLIPLEGGRNYVSYNNLLMDVRADETTVYVPTYDLPELDAWALQRYESWGMVAVGIDVSNVYRFNGSVRCLVNVLSRR